MDTFFSSPIIKGVTFSIAIIFFMISPLVNGLINRRLPADIKDQHAKLTKDMWLKVGLLFLASIFAGFWGLVNGNFDQAISQALFGVCLFSPLESFWTIKKTNISIQEAKGVSLTGSRAERIKDIDNKNNIMAKKTAWISFGVGLLGSIYSFSVLFEMYKCSWCWFLAFFFSAFAANAARWSDAASFAIAQYVTDENHGR